MTAAEALLLLARTEMKPFDKGDYMAFGGVSSDNPLIGENGDWLIILDGDELEFFLCGDESECRFILKTI
jgi:hypothetical protein